MKLKEMLVRSELNEKQITDLKQRLACVQNNLQQAERNNQELTVSFYFTTRGIYDQRIFAFRMLSSARK